jgi:hypothetical protein
MPDVANRHPGLLRALLDDLDEVPAALSVRGGNDNRMTFRRSRARLRSEA